MRYIIAIIFFLWCLGLALAQSPVTEVKFHGNNTEEIKKFCPEAIVDSRGRVFLKIKKKKVEVKPGQLITKDAAGKYAIVDLKSEVKHQ